MLFRDRSAGQESVDDLNIIKGYVDKGFVVSSPTIAGLAKKLGINTGNLEETVNLYQRNAKEGKDPQFGQTSFGTFLDHPLISLKLSCPKKSSYVPVCQLVKGIYLFK